MEPNTGCWLWTGAYDTKSGYGSFGIDGRRHSAHRASWELHFGDIPSGLCVCHKCDTPQCVNPLHLFLGTHTDNAMDKVRKGRDNTPMGVNQRNAKLTDDDVMKIRNDTRTCKTIAAEYGIDGSTCSIIQLGRTWQHVGGVIRNSKREKLTIEQVCEIVKDDRGATAIARDYGVSRRVIRAIQGGETWKYVNRPQ